MEGFLDSRLRPRDADDHAPKRRRLDLVEVAEEHRDLDLRELADHAGQHRVVGRFADERQAQQEICAGQRRLRDFAAAERRWKLVREQDADEVLRDGLLRVREDLEDGALLGDDAVLDDGDLVADVLDDLHLVRDDDDRQRELAVDVLDELEDRARRLRVEGACRLVAEQDFRLARECAGDADALLLAAGELRGILVRLVRQSDEIQERQHLFLDLFFRCVREA